MTRRRGYDPRRMRRACELGCKKLGDQRYRISGSDEPYYDVDLTVDPCCYCADAQYRGETMCKHELCARLHDGDHQLILALGQMLATKLDRRIEAGLE